MSDEQKPTEADMIDTAKRALLRGIESAAQNRDAAASSLASAYMMLRASERPRFSLPGLDSGMPRDSDVEPTPGG